MNHLLPSSGGLQLEPRELGSDHYKFIIRQMNLKVTHQRVAILETILHGRTHVSAQSVYETVVKKHPDIGFATVYRFLRSLSEYKFLTEVRVGGQPARYEWASRRHHDHLTCTVCHRICEFENEAIEKLQDKIASQLGFKLTHHLLELYGICADCHEEIQ